MATTRTTRRAKLRVKETVDLQKLRRQLQRYEDHYFNTDETLVPDDVYDALRERLRKLSPNDPMLNRIGAEVTTGKKVTLRHKMPSLDKIYPERGADRWFENNGIFTASDKLDGVAAQHINIDGEEYLFTRGNGSVGQDISALIPKIAGLGTPRKGEAVRVELMIPKGSFSKNWAKKFSNARNTVSGVVNSGDPKSPVLKDILAIAHGMLNPKRSLKSSAAYMKSRGYTVVPYKTFNNPSIDEVQKYLEQRKTSSKFELDGLVLESTDEQIAFKVNSEAKEGKVREIEWTMSKNKLLIPVVILERSLSLSGVSVSRATAHNARFVKDAGIGPGAIVYITRAGDVIPKIVGVKTPVKPDLPVGAKWDAKKTHLIGTPKTQTEKNSVYVKRLSESLRILGVPQIREGLVTKLVEAGYTTLLSLFKADDSDFQSAGLGPTQADILYTGLRTARRNATHTTMMWASGKFPHGMGFSRFDAINNNIPYDKMRFMSDRALFKQILTIPGFSDITAQQFVVGFNKYVNFITKLRWRPKVVNRRQDDSLKNVSVVFTGFRDRNIETVIRSRGGKISGSVSKTTTVLVVADTTKLTSVKAKKAKSLGVKVMTLDKFADSYGIQLTERQAL